MADNILSPMQMPQGPSAFDQATQVPTEIQGFTPEQLQAAKLDELAQEMQNIKGHGTYGQDPMLLEQAAMQNMQQRQNRQMVQQQEAASQQQLQMQQQEQLNAQRQSLGIPIAGQIPNHKMSDTPLDTSTFPEEQQQPSQKSASLSDPFSDSGGDMQMQGIRSAQRAGQEAAVAQQAAYDTKQALHENEAARNLVREQKLVEIGDTALKTYESAQKEASDFKFQDIWADKSSGQKVLAGIAMALGGLGGAYTGKGDNKAMDVLNKAIENDLNLQKLNYGKLKDKAEGAKNLYSMNMAKFNNENLAHDATYSQLLAAANNKLTSIASKYDNQVVQAKYQMLGGQLVQLQNDRVAKLKQGAIISATLNGQNGDIKNLQPQEVAAIDSAQKGFAERYVPGYGPAVNKEGAQEFQKIRASHDPAIAGAQRLLELSKGLNRITDRKQLAQIETELIALKGQLREPFTGPGAMREEEYERLGKAIGDPRALMSLPSLEKIKLQTVLKKLVTDRDIAAGRAGFRPQTQMRPDQKFNK